MNPRPCYENNNEPKTLSKYEKILKRQDFVNLNRSGKRFQARHFVVILKENRLGIRRLGVTVTKKTGNAVKRNRVKRLIREFFRLHKPFLPQSHDILIIAKKNASELNFWQVKEELGAIFFHNKAINQA